jgi:hypothetical protein
MSRWREFVEDGDGRGSAARLNMVIGVIVGSITVLWFTIKENLGGEIFTAYMACTGGVYGFSKYRESAVAMQQIKSEPPYQPAEPVAPAPGAVINVNAAEQSKTADVKDVAIKAEGDVTVNGHTKRKRK